MSSTVNNLSLSLFVFSSNKAIINSRHYPQCCSLVSCNAAEEGPTHGRR